MIRAIVAVDKKWGIGKKNDLLFNLPLDMKFFRETTLGYTVCMGYNTLLSFPNSKPLPKRKNIVLCAQEVERDDVVMVHSLDEMLSKIKAEKDVFIIGGAMFYRTMLPYCDEVLVTKVDADGDAEVFYENLDLHPDFKCVYESETFETNGYNIKFTTYKNQNVKRI
ncbi:MAG: dihydrofolate reductase [Clostridia bacterium]|nr:dihydrofolate reductase [Clostridia bacterium]